MARESRHLDESHETGTRRVSASALSAITIRYPLLRMITFNLPDLGEGLPEAEIVSWHVKPGQHIELDQPLLSVETAKAVVEVPSPYSGTIAHLHAQAGDTVQTGRPAGRFRSA